MSAYLNEELQDNTESQTHMEEISNNTELQEINNSITPDSTLTTACFDLTRFHNKSRNLNESINNMKTLLSVPCYLVIYTDNICIDFIKEIRNSFNLDHLTHYIVTNIEDLSNYKYLDTIKSNREKYWPTRDERTSAESHFICCSKFEFVLQTMEKNPFHTTRFGWIDANLNNNFSKISEGFNIDMLMNILHNSSDKFHIQILNVNDKNYKNKEDKLEYYERYRWVVCGCLFITGKEIGIKVLNRLNQSFIETTILGYGHGEEMLYLEVLDEFYDDIERSYGDYGQIVNNYFYPTRNLYYINHLIIKNYLNFYYHRECYDCCEYMLNGIENYNVSSDENLYMDILHSYFVSSYYYKRNESLRIVNHIYDVCEKNPALKNVFNSQKEFYESQFNLVK